MSYRSQWFDDVMAVRWGKQCAKQDIVAIMKMMIARHRATGVLFENGKPAAEREILPVEAPQLPAMMTKIGFVPVMLD